jgi:hypothetical protein
VLLDASKQYLIDWYNKYNMQVQYMIDNWQEVEF